MTSPHHLFAQATSTAESIVGSLGVLGSLFTLLFLIMLVLMPFVIWDIRSHAKRQTALLRGVIDELRAAQLVQNKLLIQIRDPLQNMAAVGVEQEESAAAPPAPVLPTPPPAVPSRRERLR